MRPPPPCSSSRCVVATVQPLFSPPTSANAGTRTSSKKTVCLTPLSVPPSPPVPISSIGCMVIPGRFASIMNLPWFMIDANLPGITMQPMELMGTGGEGGTDSGVKQTVFFDDVRVPAFALVGGENKGWTVATTHLELEHGGGGRIGRNRVWDRLLRYCQETKRDGVPLSQQQDVRDSLADIYIKTEITRLFGLRNFYLTYARKPKSYEGPQLSYYRKTAGLWMTGAILEAVGPAALTTDPTWGSSAGFLETQQRNGIVSVHPGGTTDIQRVQMARRIGIGRSTREKAGTVHGAET